MHVMMSEGVVCWHRRLMSPTARCLLRGKRQMATVAVADASPDEFVHDDEVPDGAGGDVEECTADGALPV
eukprot:2222540-Pyramimonas_sp.AAC.2